MTTFDDEVFDSPTPWVADHIRAYLDTGGTNGHLYQGLPTLLLTTRGRRSGKLRRTALIYGRDDERFVLVASNAGAEQHPAWYLNLAEHPRAGVQLGAEIFTVRARTATARERPLLWRRMAAIFPMYDTYQARSTRSIPVVILDKEPR